MGVEDGWGCVYSHVFVNCLRFWAFNYIFEGGVLLVGSFLAGFAAGNKITHTNNQLSLIMGVACVSWHKEIKGARRWLFISLRKLTEALQRYSFLSFVVSFTSLIRRLSCIYRVYQVVEELRLLCCETPQALLSYIQDVWGNKRSNDSTFSALIHTFGELYFIFIT